MFSDKIHKNKKMYQKDFQHILEKGMDYCIISAGINDASTKVGASFYATNMELIIHHLAAIGTVPVILEIPQFDIHKAYRQTSIPTKLLRHISMTVNNDSIDCIGKYRTALAKMLAERRLEGKIIYIPHTEWSKHGYADARNIFSGDGVHLNKKGFLILDQCIIRHIREHASAGNKATF